MVEEDAIGINSNMSIFVQQAISEILNDGDDVTDDVLSEQVETINLPDILCMSGKYILSENYVSGLALNQSEGYMLIENVEYEDAIGDLWNVFVTSEGITGGIDEPEFMISPKIGETSDVYILNQVQNKSISITEEQSKLASDLRMIIVTKSNDIASVQKANTLLKEVSQLPDDIVKRIGLFVTGHEYDNKSAALQEMKRLYNDVLLS